MADYHYEIATGYDGGGDTHEILYWTTEPPTVDGWYWVPNGEAEREIVRVELPDVFRNGTDVAHNVSEFTHWMGPLPEPEKPARNTAP